MCKLHFYFLNFSLILVSAKETRSKIVFDQILVETEQTRSNNLGKFSKLWQPTKVNNNVNNTRLEISKLLCSVIELRSAIKRSKLIFAYLLLTNHITDCIDRTKLILESGDVERNPGPVSGDKVNVRIVTYNIRGLKEYSKLKRVLNKCAGKLKENSNYVFNFQETHLGHKDENKLRVMWRSNYAISPGGNKDRGCLTLFDTSWEILDSVSDPGGRYNFITIKKQLGTLTIANLYAPNDQSLEFFEEICRVAIEIKDKFNSELIISGDYNLVLDAVNDSQNRTQTNREIIIGDFIKSSFRAMGLCDVYRVKHLTGGYTWSRGTCMSRLDMIFLTKNLVNKVNPVSIDWAFDRSDHALLECSFSVKPDIMRGKGLPRVDTKLLENVNIVNELRDNLTTAINNIPDHWDPHKSWEYIKVMIRTSAWELSNKSKRQVNSEEEALIAQINSIQKYKSDLLLENNTGATKFAEIDVCLKGLNQKLNKIWIDKSKKLAAMAKVKWFNEGEKSNKYFLNIIKKRQTEVMLSELKNGDIVASGQAEVQSMVAGFYSELYNERNDLSNNYESFYPSGTPKLDNGDRANLDGKITLDELRSTLKTCGDSAPGPDGISYKFYEHLWDLLGPPLLRAWEYSHEIGFLPDSQRKSTITLLPKEGKDTSQIANWRPITLSNCDLKIFTKTIANRVAKVLDKIIIPTQTAYIPGRVVHDNLRMFEFYRKYCHENNVEAVLMSLDAKKELDSVDHKYMFNTLRLYGFSEEFIDTVKLLYKDIEADILVNGYRTTLIKIRRCVKQGDAFSCALFIICIDPLLRNIEANKKIEAIELRTPLSLKTFKPKTGAFADDVGTLIKFNRVSINEVFTEYRKFSNLSGIELNESKTEILMLGNNNPFISQDIVISAGSQHFTVKTLESVKICGITYSNNDGLAYEQNILSKIHKLDNKLLAWQFRGLSLGGKILVAKTFGVSQLIYSLQACKIKEQDIKKTEAFMFKILWTKKVGGNWAPDRIKRSIMKRDYDQGGLKVVDIGSLDRALKLRQFFKANLSNHPISDIQKYIIESLDYDSLFNQDYARFTTLESIVCSAQHTQNDLSLKMRDSVDEEIENNIAPSSVKIDLIAAIDVIDYLDRNKLVLLSCFFKPLFRCGIENFKQLVMEFTYPRSDNFARLARLVVNAFAKGWIRLIQDNITCNSEIELADNIMLDNNKSVKSDKCTVAMIKKRLLTDNNRDPFPFESKLGITRHEGLNPFIVARKVNHSTNLKIFKFRLLHMDIFTKERMFKYKMTTNEKCDFCGVKETVRHVLWECQRARGLWNNLNILLSTSGNEAEICFDNLFVGFNPTNKVLECIITRFTQILLRIDRANAFSNELIRSELIQLATQNIFIKNESIIILNSWKQILGSLQNT